MRRIIICSLLAGGMFMSGGAFANEGYADDVFAYDDVLAYEVDAAVIAQFLETVHTSNDIANSDGAKNDGATSQEGLITHDATCQSCHGSNFFDEIVVTGRRSSWGVTIVPPPPNIGRGFGGIFGGPGSIGGGDEDADGGGDEDAECMAEIFNHAGRDW